MMRFYLSFNLFLLLFLFQGSYLCFGKDKSILGYFSFQCLQSFLECFQIMSEPHASDSRRGYYLPSFLQFITDSLLPMGWLLGGIRHHQLFDLFFNPVLQQWFAAADLFKCKFTALFIQLLKTVETVSGVAQHLTGL